MRVKTFWDCLAFNLIGFLFVNFYMAMYPLEGYICEVCEVYAWSKRVLRIKTDGVTVY